MVTAWVSPGEGEAGKGIVRNQGKTVYNELGNLYFRISKADSGDGQV